MRETKVACDAQRFDMFCIIEIVVRLDETSLFKRHGVLMWGKQHF